MLRRSCAERRLCVLQGMATPLIAHKRDGRSGIITHAEDQRPKVGGSIGHALFCSDLIRAIHLISFQITSSHCVCLPL